MIDGNVNEFVDHMRYGDELIFMFRGQKFFIQGYIENEKATLYLDRWEPPSADYILVEEGSDAKHYPVEEFLKAKVWDGMDFWQAEGEMTWVDA